MLVSHFFDLIPIWVLLVATIFALVVFIESGFRLVKKAQATAKKAPTSQSCQGAGSLLSRFTYGR